MSGQSELRRFRAGDEAALHRLIGETIDRSYAPVYPPRALDFFKRFHDPETIRQRAGDGTILVIEADGEPVATGSLVDGEIFAVFVDPRRQGEGLGRRLMAALESAAREAGVRESVLSVSLPARAFYEGLGYEITETVSRPLGEGQSLDFWKARKRL